jgi:hypothetical protein
LRLRQCLIGGAGRLGDGFADAASAVGEIVGQAATEDLLDSIFARFASGSDFNKWMAIIPKNPLANSLLPRV